jgi:hypothetical protein
MPDWLKAVLLWLVAPLLLIWVIASISVDALHLIVAALVLAFVGAVVWNAVRS